MGLTVLLQKPHLDSAVLICRFLRLCASLTLAQVASSNVADSIDIVACGTLYWKTCCTGYHSKIQGLLFWNSTAFTFLIALAFVIKYTDWGITPRLHFVQVRTQLLSHLLVIFLSRKA